MQQSWNIVSKFSVSAGLFAGLCGLALAGCSKSTTPTAAPGSIGIVDLAEVSKAVGWANDIDDDRKGAIADVERDFKTYADSVQKAWEDRRKVIGAAAHLNTDQMAVINAPQINGDDFQKLNMPKDQKDDFLRSANEAAQALNAAKQQAQQTLQQRESRVNESYIEAMKPAVRRVAGAAGVTTVLPSNGVFYFDPQVDLSNQVVDDLRKTPPPHNMPPMPKLNLNEFRFSTAPAAVTPTAAVTPAAPTHTPPTDSH